MRGGGVGANIDHRVKLFTEVSGFSPLTFYKRR